MDAAQDPHASSTSPPSPALQLRHRTLWQRKCRSCVSQLRQASRDWDRAQADGLAAANAMSNHIIVRNALVAKGFATKTPAMGQWGTRGGDGHGDGDEVDSGAIARASLAKLDEEIADAFVRLEDALRGIESARDAARDAGGTLPAMASASTASGKEDAADAVSGLDLATRKKLEATQPIYFSVTPKGFATRIGHLVQAFERECHVKRIVVQFFQTHAHAQEQQKQKQESGEAKTDFSNSQTIEDKLKCHLVVWMLEPELDQRM